ncbi:MAG TPA: magnesium/cobalt transporter CorA [Candidatus Krumholzibacteria bacterium]|nr:magnesium/cobalt transporter CorA [Candidatus Krumholzibacteria bacterium]
MARVFSVHRDRIGRSPGTVEYLGARKVERVAARAHVYGPDGLADIDLETVLEGAGPAPQQTLWVDVLGLHDTELVARLGRRFGIDTLILEDVLSTTQRAKVEDRDDYLYLVCRSSIFAGERGRAETEQVSIILGEDFVLSFQEREPDVFAPVRERLERGRGRLRTGGSSYLAYALLDAVVDGHLLALSQFGERVEALEEEMLDEPSNHHFTAIHNLKRELILLRRAIRPMRDMTATLTRLDQEHFGEENRLFLADLQDHTIQTSEAIDSYNELLDGMHDFHQSTVGQRLNEVMKVLTIISTLFVPLTFVAGIYGMNFQYMPELGWRWSYALFWVVIGGVSVGMLTFFRRRRWI